ILAVSAAGLVFAGWECLVAWGYGESHFLYHARTGGRSWPDLAWLPGAILPILGGVAPSPALIGMIGLRWRQWSIVAGAGLRVAGYLLVACLPTVDSGPAEAADGKMAISAADVTYAAWGLLLLGILAAVLRCLFRHRRDVATARGRRDLTFLVAWLAL